MDLSQAPDTTCDWAAVSIAESTIVTFQKRLTGADWDIYASINGNRQVNLTAGTQPGTYGHPVFELHDDTIPVIHLLWNRELSAATSEAAYQRFQLGLTNGGYGGGQSASRIDPTIRPELATPFPNPFNRTTSIRYAINQAGRVALKVFNLSGRTVRTLVNQTQQPGRYSLVWNARGNRQQPAAKLLNLKRTTLVEKLKRMGQGAGTRRGVP